MDTQTDIQTERPVQENISLDIDGEYQWSTVTTVLKNLIYGNFRNMCCKAEMGLLSYLI